MNTVAAACHLQIHYDQSQPHRVHYTNALTLRAAAAAALLRLPLAAAPAVTAVAVTAAAVHLAAAALTACGGALVLLLLLQMRCCHRCDQAPVHVQPVMLALPAAEPAPVGAVLHALPSLVLQLRRLL
eukprot:14741-Heterococcus_DN1.PRE.1